MKKRIVSAAIISLLTIISALPSFASTRDMFIGADIDITDNKITDELISQINMYRVSDREVTEEDMDLYLPV